VAAIAVFGLSALAIGAQAGETHDVPTRAVRYSDLDLSTEKGAAVLYNRIRQAAEEVCGDPNSRQLAEAAAAKACVGRAVSSSVQAVNNAKLTRVYDNRNGVKSINVAALR
jgi:UrcA family protein